MAVGVHSLQTLTLCLNLLEGEHSEILDGIAEGYRKSGFWRTKALVVVSLKHGKMGPRLLLRSNRKSYTRFRWVPKQGPWMTSKRDSTLLALKIPQNDEMFP